MNEKSRFDVVVLAGDRKASIAIEHENKTFLTLHQWPLLIHILRALQGAKHTGEIIVIGPAARLKESLQSHREALAKPEHIRVVEQRNNLIENIKTGLIASLNLSDEPAFETLRSTPHAETPILIVPGDCPLLTPQEIDQLIERSDLREHDYAIGITSETVLRHYHPTAFCPGIQMIYFHTREDLMRHNNLHFGRPLKFEHLDPIEKMYEWRYQTRGRNIVHMLAALPQIHGHLFDALSLFCALQLSLFFDRHGCAHLADRLRQSISLRRIARCIGRIVGAPTQLVYTDLGGAALDVDHAENLRAMEMMYEDWMRHQHRLDAQSTP